MRDKPPKPGFSRVFVTFSPARYFAVNINHSPQPNFSRTISRKFLSGKFTVRIFFVRESLIKRAAHLESALNPVNFRALSE